MSGDGTGRAHGVAGEPEDAGAPGRAGRPALQGSGVAGAAVAAQLDAVCAALLLVRHGAGTPATDEAALQRRVLAALERAGIPAAAEVRLNERDRIDVLTAVGIGIECKVRGAAAAIHRQLLRYAESDRVRALVLVAPRPVVLTREVLGKPARAVSLWQGML